MNYNREYRKKLLEPEEAVKIIKSGDHVSYGAFACTPMYLDRYLAKRAGELENVTVTGVTFPGIAAVATADPERKSFIYRSTHFSKGDRMLHDRGLCDMIPNLFHEGPSFSIKEYVDSGVCIVRAAPMDNWGFFNIGIGNSVIGAGIAKADKIIIEVNDNIPYCYGGYGEGIHISKVDHIVESDGEPLISLPPAKPTKTDEIIARYIIDEITDGACMQLGIGSLPNAIGELIAESDLKHLGVHTEMFVDAYIKIFERGLITGRRKIVAPGKMTYTFALGSTELYEFLDKNPYCASYPVDYLNDPKIIAQNPNVISINNALEIDLYGQVSSESSGTRNISGTGGQFDFAYGAYHSRDGKSFICLPSTRKDSKGTVHSTIVPYFKPGTIVTCHRAIVHYIVTEYGMTMLKGKSTWERAEALINISHPDFREQLIKDAEEMNIWTRTNKQDG